MARTTDAGSGVHRRPHTAGPVPRVCEHGPFRVFIGDGQVRPGGARGACVVCARGRDRVRGHRYSVQDERTGFVAGNIDEFVAFAERFLHDQKLAAAMGEADREYAEISWEQQIFEDVYRTYERCFLAPGEVAQGVFDATSEFGALQPAGLTGLSGCGHTFGSR